MFKNKSLKLLIPAIMVFACILVFSCQKKQQLTEKEQEEFAGCIEPQSLNQENALKYLKILLKGDADAIQYYGKYEKDENRFLIADRRSLYQTDICSVVQFLFENKGTIQVISGDRYIVQSSQLEDRNSHSVQILSEKNIKEIEEGYNLTLQVINKKEKYPRARLCAIRAISLYGEFRDGRWHGDKSSVPVLKKVLNDKDPEIRLEAAGVLLKLGRGDIALPVLDEIAKAGIPESVQALRRISQPFSKGLRDERGREILIRALNYSSDEVKAYAALTLAGMGMKEKLAEDTAIKVLNRLRNIERTDKPDREARKKLYSQRQAGYYAIAVLGRVKGTAGINALKVFAENNSDTRLQKRAKTALENIQGE